MRLLPTLLAFALVAAGVGGTLLWLTERDRAVLTSTTPVVARTSTQGLPPGNVVVEYGSQRDRIRIDRLAERLGAIDMRETREAGQALISRESDGPGDVITAYAGDARLTVDDATDPQLADFVLRHLGRVDAR